MGCTSVECALHCPFLHAMARLPRLVVPHQPHHLIQTGHDQLAIFREDEDYQRFLGWLRESAREFKVAIHAYVLMPDHVHLLATPGTDEGLAKMMQRVGRHYVPWYNAKYGRSGSLFQGRFKTSVIDAERYFMQCSRFVESNPVPVKASLAMMGLCEEAFRSPLAPPTDKTRELQVAYELEQLQDDADVSRAVGLPLAFAGSPVPANGESVDWPAPP